MRLDEMFKSNPYGMFCMPDIETDRLLLRRMTMKDADDIFAYSRDEEVARHVLWSAQRSVSEAKDYIRFMLRRYRDDQPSSWCIEEKASGRVVGTIGYMDHNIDNASVEVGYSLARHLWGKGLMTEALRAVIGYTFESMDIERIEAQHETDNPSSGRVMEKCGMVKEGILRHRLMNKGRFVDVALYAILREDHRPGKKQEQWP